MPEQGALTHPNLTAFELLSPGVRGIVLSHAGSKKNAAIFVPKSSQRQDKVPPLAG